MSFLAHLAQRFQRRHPACVRGLDDGILGSAEDAVTAAHIACPTIRVWQNACKIAFVRV
jgi:hypothetical protein